jgi:GNAT superfamily N-acetyltransferase
VLLGAARQDALVRRGGPLLLLDACPPAGEVHATAAELDRWIAAGDDHVLLAGTFDGVVVGLGAAHVRATTETRGPADPAGIAGRTGVADPRGAPGRMGVVDCCYVEPAARGVGVGGALASALVAWLAERGCAGVDVLALPGDRETKQLFESEGFSARLLVLHRPLP